MKNKLNIILIFLFASIFALVFYKWFFGGEITGGDWPYLFKESLENYHILVPSWNTWQGNGLGGTNPIYFLQSFEYLTVSLANFMNIPWPVIYKIFWFGLFIALSIVSSIYLLKTIFSKALLWQMGTAALIFTTNTYILMVVGGGQMGIALAYSIAPLVLGVFIRLINLISSSDFNSKFPSSVGRQIQNSKLSVLAGLTLSVQVLFDPRIAYISMIAVFIYMVFKIKKSILSILFSIFYTFVIPGFITLLLHIFWILPFLIFSQNICERFCEAYTGVGIVKFLSFSTFSQSFSLLHSNWPENIFGKVGFMKPEFILIPIIAYSSLLFKFRRRVLFFALLGIVGAFLAKGANPPFGEVYLWLFENVPGFELFRDPTKFYLLIALSYSILIPFSISNLTEKISSIKYPHFAKASRGKKVLISAAFLVVWAILIHPAILGQLGGTFKKHEVPREYVELKDFLYKQPDFFRILWVPRQQRFVFYSKVHPSVEAGALFGATSSAQAIRSIMEKGPQYFSDLSVKYIIVPYDSLGEFFLTDRKYDKKIPNEISKSLEAIPWLKKINRFGNLTVFETLSPKDHFWLEKFGKISYKRHSSTSYSISVSIVNSQKLIFSEKYNPSWVAKIGDRTIKSQKTSTNSNSFVLEKGDYSLEIIFLQDKLYNYGRLISILTFLAISILLLRRKIIFQH